MSGGRLRISAIVVGGLVDVGATLALGLALTFGYSFYLASRDLPPREIELAVTAAFERSDVVLGTIVVGTAFTVLGGYVCGRLAGHSEVRHAAFLGIVLVGLGVLLNQLPENARPIWIDGLGYLLTLVAAVVGGYWASRRA